MKRWLFVAALAVSCGSPQPPPLPPPDGPGDCDTACANIRRIGGCGQDMSGCEGWCRDEEAAQARLGMRFPVGCLTAARTCEEALLCE